MNLEEAIKELQEGNTDSFKQYVSERAKEVTRDLVNEGTEELEESGGHKTSDKNKKKGNSDKYSSKSEDDHDDEDESDDDSNDDDSDDDEEEVEEKYKKKEYKKKDK